METLQPGQLYWRQHPRLATVQKNRRDYRLVEHPFGQLMLILDQYFMHTIWHGNVYIPLLTIQCEGDATVQLFFSVLIHLVMVLDRL